MHRRCVACRLENPNTYSFCAKCGTALGSHCPRCGFFAVTGDVHCGGCGVNFAEPNSESTTAAETPALPAPVEFDLDCLKKEASEFREEIEKQDQLDQGDIDALFSDS